MNRFLSACIILLLSALPALAQESRPAPRPAMPRLPDGARVLRDIDYIEKDPHARQTLDLVLPKSDRPTPLIIWVHGGGWELGAKSLVAAPAFVTEGYAYAAINYRLSQHAVFPAQLDDCKSAIRFLRANAEKYNLDPKRIGVWGASAGGHLVALLGTSGNSADADAANREHADQSSAVSCVVDLFGPTDLATMVKMFPKNDRFDINGPTSPVTKLLGGPAAEKADLVKKANPLTYIDKSDPPFLIIHGDADPIVPWQQSQLLHDALKKAEVSSTLKIVKGASHGPGILNNADIQADIRAFFNKHLKEAQGQP